MPIVKGRTMINFQVRLETKTQLEAIKNYHRDRTNPNCSMTLVIEQLVAKEFKRLKL